MSRGRGQILVALFLLLFVAMTAYAQSFRRLALPSARQTIRDRIRAEQLLRGGRGPERTLPGPVTDTEEVAVKVTPDGVPWRVVVDQRLAVDGVGDYFVKIPGPVRSAIALPDSTAEPGLRSGSLVWQGFATEGELLAARVGLDPKREQERLPLAIKVRGSIDGGQVDFDARSSGVLRLDIRVTNTTGAEVLVPAGDPVEPEVVARVLDRTVALLERHQRPDPGHDGIPKAIRVTGAVKETSSTVVAPLAVRLTVAFDDRETSGRPRRIERSVRLSGSRQTFEFHVARRILDTRPRVKLEVEAALPPSPEIPGRVGSWEAAVLSRQVNGRTVVDRLSSVLAETARLPDIDGYLGNPDRDGKTATTYRFEVAAQNVVAESEPRSPETRKPSLLAVATAVIALLAVAMGLVVWWALS